MKAVRDGGLTPSSVSLNGRNKWRRWLIYSKNSMLYRVIEGDEVDYKERHFFCGDKRLLASATYRNDRDGGVP